MDQRARYVAYYRLPSSGTGDRVPSLDRQKRIVSGYLENREHDLVGEFTEVRPPADDTLLGSAFALALDCCETLDASMVAALSETTVGHSAIQETRERGISLEFVGSNLATEDIFPLAASPVPYLPLRELPRPPVPLRDDQPIRQPAGNREKADRFARDILPIIEQIRAAGATTLTDIADELNARQVRTARGRRWYPTTVRNILNRTPDKRSE